MRNPTLRSSDSGRSRRLICGFAILSLFAIVLIPNAPLNAGPSGAGLASVSAGSAASSGSARSTGKGRSARGLGLSGLQEAFEPPTHYEGPRAAVKALLEGAAQPLSLASGDFQGDGIQDLVCGYSYRAGGVLALRTRRSVSAVAGAGSAPLIPVYYESKVVKLPVAPDYLVAGDFDRNGHTGIAAARKNDGVLYLLRGDGAGNLAQPEAVPLPGRIVALAAYPSAGPRGRGGATIAIALTEAGRTDLFTYPEARSFALPVQGQLSGLALGRLTGGEMPDIIAASGRQLYLLPSLKDSLARGAALSLTLPSAIRGIVAGRFSLGDRDSVAVLLENGSAHVISADTDDGSSIELVDRASARVMAPVTAAGRSESLLAAFRFDTNGPFGVVAGSTGTRALRIFEADGDAMSLALRDLGSLNLETPPVALTGLAAESASAESLAVLREGRVQPATFIASAFGSTPEAIPTPEQEAGGIAPAGIISFTYDSIPSPFPFNVPSLGFEATQTVQFGDLIQFSGTNRVLTTVTLVMSDFAIASQFGSSNPTWSHPITLNLYNVDNSGPNPAPGTLIATRTATFAIPWRPAADPTCSDPTQWRASDNNCYSGLAFTINFDFTNTTVPNQIIYGVSYNTHNYGPNPIGTSGPYDKLNFGLADVPPTVGSNPFPDTAYWNTPIASNYADGGTAGVGIFRRDTGWSPFSGAISFQATAAAFSTCVQDDTTGDFIHWDPTSGNYVFTHCGPNGFTLTGTGTVSSSRGVNVLRDIKPDRNISAKFNTGTLTGTATVIVISGSGISQTFHINDTNPHATCTCGG